MSLRKVARLCADRKRLRALGRALRADVDRFGPTGPPDAALVAPVASPFETPAEAATSFEELETRLREREDRRAVFLTIYSRMTQSVRAGIENGRFADPAWMRRYTTGFANYYRRAFVAFERGELGAVPDPWKVAFGTAVRGEGLVIQDAYLGVNAHINYDLALTLRDVGIDPDRPGKHADHREINEILGGLVDAQQEALADLYAPGIEDFDAIFGRFDEAVSLVSMIEGREFAWEIAVVLTDSGWPTVRSLARWLLRGVAVGGALIVRSPSFDPELLATLRRVEADRLPLADVLARTSETLDDAT